MSNQDTKFMLPVGRMVQGSLYEPETKDDNGQQLVFKSGPNAGQPRVQYYVAIAIPKNGEAHWSQTPWGSRIAAVGQSAFPNLWQNPAFSWKIVDGDSQIANLRGRRPCDNEGFPGHWIVKCGSGYAPKMYNENASQELTEPNAIVPGYYVQAYVSCVSNNATGQAKPGVIVNLHAISRQAYGAVIQGGADYSGVGFGQGVQLPPGASATPLSQVPPAGMPNQQQQQQPGGFPMAGGNPGAAGFPTAGAPVPGAFPAPAAQPAPGAFPAAQAPAPMNIPPSASFMQPPQQQPQQRIMTPKAQGATYEQFVQAGYTDEMMRQQGFML